MYGMLHFFLWPWVINPQFSLFDIQKICSSPILVASICIKRFVLSVMGMHSGPVIYQPVLVKALYIYIFCTRWPPPVALTFRARRTHTHRQTHHIKRSFCIAYAVRSSFDWLLLSAPRHDESVSAVAAVTCHASLKLHTGLMLLLLCCCAMLCVCFHSAYTTIS